jgi:large subunit ribosomal protein L15
MFEDGALVDETALRKLGLVNGTVKRFKVLGFGALKKKLTVQAHAFSKAAKDQIEAAGGRCEIIAQSQASAPQS